MTSDRAVIVTGANGGIGEATVRRLARQGYSVYAAIRQSDSDLAGPNGVQTVFLDVTDPNAVGEAAKHIEHDLGGRSLWALVNNAGVIVQGPLELLPPDELRRQFEINTFGPVWVTQSFLPLLRSGNGRVVNVSAPTAHLPPPFLAPIAASKAALSTLSDSLRIELKAWGIPVSVIYPGARDTRIFGKAEAAARSALNTADPARVRLYQAQVAAFDKFMTNQRLRPPDDVARTIVRAVDARRPKRRYTAGLDARMIGWVAHLPSGLRERLLARMSGISQVRVVPD